jgi:hypothetical protein
MVTKTSGSDSLESHMSFRREPIALTQQTQAIISQRQKEMES